MVEPHGSAHFLQTKAASTIVDDAEKSKLFRIFK